MRRSARHRATRPNRVARCAAPRIHSSGHYRRPRLKSCIVLLLIVCLGLINDWLSERALLAVHDLRSDLSSD